LGNLLEQHKADEAGLELGQGSDPLNFLRETLPSQNGSIGLAKDGNEKYAK
jgi:hypothetical protein